MSFFLSAALPVLLVFAVVYGLCEWFLRRVGRDGDNDDRPPREGI